MVTDVSGQKCVWKKKNEKNPVCETVVWSLADRVKNLIKKMTRSVRQYYGQWRVNGHIAVTVKAIV